MAARSSDRRRRAVSAEHAGRRAGDHQPPRAEPRGQMPRQRVGVHVEQPTVRGRSRCTRRPARTGRRRASVSSVVSAAALGMPTRPRSTDRPSTARCGGASSDRPQPASAPVSPTARTPAAIERRDEPRVDGAGQHRHDDVQRRVVGDPQAVDLPLLDAGRLERRVDLLAAAVDDDQRHALLRRRARWPTTTVARARSSSSSPPNLRTSGPSTSAF